MIKLYEGGDEIVLDELSALQENELRELTAKLDKTPVSLLGLSLYPLLSGERVLSHLTCSCCGGFLSSVRYGGFMRLFKRGNVGFFCIVPHCKFYHRFIPVRSVLEFAFLKFEQGVE